MYTGIKNAARTASPGRWKGVLWMVAASVLVLGVGPAHAQDATPTPTASPQGTPYFLGDGALQNASGGWDLPQQGSCPADATRLTRPDCVALRFPTYTSKSTCEATPTPSGPAQRSWSTGACNDLDPAHQTSATCNAVPGRLWSNGVCAVTMKGHSRNVATCVKLGGTWVTSGVCTGAWVMASATLYTPNVITGSASTYPLAPGAGDQCLRCHNLATQYNGTDIRWVGEGYLKTGHKNMGRKVAPVGDPNHGKPWAGPDGVIYAADGSVPPNTFNWADGTITIASGANAGTRTLYWIYGDWMAPGVSAIYQTATGTALSYSCGRCHMTGFTAGDTSTTREPRVSFAGASFPSSTGAWDQFGIVCSRCHGSVVDKTTNGGVPPFTAPPGMKTHSNNLTSASNSSGVCTLPNYTEETLCTTNGGSWLTACSVNPTTAVCTQAITNSTDCLAVPGGVTTWTDAGFCSNNVSYTTETDCTNNGFTWQAGWCVRTDKDATTCSGGSGTSALTWQTNGTQASCQVGGGTWTFTSCSVPAICSVAGYTDYTSCTGAGGSWVSTSSEYTCIEVGVCSTTVQSCTADSDCPAGETCTKEARYTGNNKYRGQIITSLCMQCHSNTTDAADPAGHLAVGSNHGVLAFTGHPKGNQFLNSPHAKFLGSAAQIPTALFGVSTTPGYSSHISSHAEAAGTGGGCTTCHNVHKSYVEEANPQGGAVVECQECHGGSHAMPLENINHLGGPGTPLEHAATEPAKACETCHMPGGLHLFRINPDPAYSTFPPEALTTTAFANQAADGTYTKAVWVDVDLACGQCHGGGTAHAVTKGDIASGSALLTVDDPTDLAPAQRISVAGAGAGGAELATNVVAVAGNTVTLLLAASTTVTDADVVQNPTTPDADYRTKAQLALVAEGMHNGGGTTYGVTFNAATTQLDVTVTASVSCGVACPALTYDWDWGDGTAHGSLASATHTYGSAGTKTINLVVKQGSATVGSSTRNVVLVAADAAPVASGECDTTLLADRWRVDVLDTSTDGDGTPISQIVIDWGDGSVLSYGAAGDTFSHVYRNPGSYPIVLQAIDSGLQQDITVPCTATISGFFTIERRVYKTASGVTPAVPASGASVTLRNIATGAYKTVHTDLTGRFQAAGLRPGDYLITITHRSGVTFPVNTITVGPSDLTGSIYANP